MSWKEVLRKAKAKLEAEAETPEVEPPEVEVIDDPELIEAAEICVREHKAAKRYSRAHKKLAKRLRGVERARLGEYEIRGRFEAATKYRVPEEVRQEYRYEDPQARWLFTVRRVG